MKHGNLRILKVIAFSFAGLKVLWNGEESFRQEAVLSLIASGVLYYLGASCSDLLIFWALILVLFCTEALNTGLERIADKIDDSKNDFTRDVKDLGAVAVFFVLIPPVVWFFIVFLKLV